MKVTFINELCVVKERGDLWRLKEPFAVVVDEERITVPAGFKTDFASVLRWPFAYWLVGNTAHESATVHDYLYSIGRLRRFDDDIFRAAMRAEGIPAWRRFLMYWAVRVGGGSHHGRS